MTSTTCENRDRPLRNFAPKRDRRPDAALLTAVTLGDRAALGELYDRIAPQLLGTATRILRNSGDAEDVVHEVFLEAWAHASTFDETRGSVRAWLTVRLRSRALDRLRARTRAQRFAEPTVEEGCEPFVPLDHHILRRAMLQLKDPLRVVLELTYFHELSIGEVAHLAGLPLGTAKSRLARGLKGLREILGPLG